MFQSLLAYISRVGIEADTAINVLLGGKLGQTVSYRCAVAARDGKRWGCVMCRLLNWIVQRDHCSLQFTDLPTPWFDGVRAALAFAAAGWVALEILRLI